MHDPFLWLLISYAAGLITAGIIVTTTRSPLDTAARRRERRSHYG